MWTTTVSTGAGRVTPHGRCALAITSWRCGLTMHCREAFKAFDAVGFVRASPAETDALRHDTYMYSYIQEFTHGPPMCVSTDTSEKLS